MEMRSRRPPGPVPSAARSGPTAIRWRTKRSGSRSSAAGSIGSARVSRSGVRRGRNGSSSSPRARAWIRAPSSPNRAISADRGSSAMAPIRRRPNRTSLARTSGSVVSSLDGCGARKSASASGGTTMGASGRAWIAAIVAANRVPAMPARMPPPSTPPSEPASAPVSRSIRTGSAPHNGSRPSTWTSNNPKAGSTRVGAAGDPRAERRERLEGRLHARPIGIGIRVEEGRLRNEPMGAPERHPPSNAQCPGFRVGVEDRARIPRPAAQDERAGREGQKELGGSRPGELEGEVWPVEMKQSHRAVSVRDGSRGLDR